MSMKIYLVRRVSGHNKKPVFGHVPNKHKPLLNNQYQSLYALVDDTCYQWLNQYYWFLDSNGYARRKIRSSIGKYIILTMADEVLKFYGLVRPDGCTSDHFNVFQPYNRLNNQLSNLRWATRSQQAGNRCGRKFKKAWLMIHPNEDFIP